LRISERAGADWVKTSTGYGFVKGADGKYSYQGATEHDLKLMRASCSPKVQVKAAGGVRGPRWVRSGCGNWRHALRRHCHRRDVG
jgi:deoxyribose-phosphate aldolase